MLFYSYKYLFGVLCACVCVSLQWEERVQQASGLQIRFQFLLGSQITGGEEEEVRNSLHPVSHQWSHCDPTTLHIWTDVLSGCWMSTKNEYLMKHCSRPIYL